MSQSSNAGLSRVRLVTGDHALVARSWQDQVATYNAEVSLTQSYQRVRLEYYEGSGSAGVRLGWERATD